MKFLYNLNFEVSVNEVSNMCRLSLKRLKSVLP